MAIHSSLEAQSALEAMQEARIIRQIAARRWLHPSQVSQWKRKATEWLKGALERALASDEKREAEVKIQMLHTKITQLVMERKFLGTSLGR